MVKKDRIVYDELEKIELLKSMDIIRIGMVDNGLAYIVPVNFVYSEGHIYFHTGLSGRKIPLLKSADKISFQADSFDGLKKGDTACAYSAYFRSITGEGIPEFLKGDDKIPPLKLLMEKYTGIKEHSFSEKVLNITEVIRIKITKLEAKVHKASDNMPS